MSDHEYSEISCPKCGHYPTHERWCTNLHCEGGVIDEYEFDAINFSEGELLTSCEDCGGTGIERWCPECGYDLSVNPENYKIYFNE